VRKNSSELPSFHVVPGHTFFYGHFTLPKAVYSEYIDFFDLKQTSLQKPIKLIIKNKQYDAIVRLARQTSPKWKKRNVLEIEYPKKYDTRKALRKLLIYSYAATIDKTNKPNLKELIEFIHVKDNVFRIKVISKQQTDFDKMFEFLERKDLLHYWQKRDDETKKEKIFISYSDSWISKKNLDKYKFMKNVIYILNNSKTNEIYIGQAKVLGKRVSKTGSNSRRQGLESFDRFLFFELHPDQADLLDDLENFSIRLLASLFTNLVGVGGIDLDQMTLVNKQIKSVTKL